MHGVHLRAPIRLRSADDLQYAFSNYVRGYIGLLDYIWYDPERLEVQVCPSPPIPSECPQNAVWTQGKAQYLKLRITQSTSGRESLCWSVS